MKITAEMASNNDILPVKARFGQQIRRIEIKRSLKFADFVAVLCGLFGRAFDLVKYKDEEGDLVTLSSEEEFHEALKKVVPKTGGVLKIVLETKDNKEPTQIDGANAKKRSSDDTKDQEMPSKKKHSENKVDCYAPLSKALKDITTETERNQPTKTEPLRVYLPPAEINEESYQPNFEELTKLCKQNSAAESVARNEEANDIKDNPKDPDSSDVKQKTARKGRRRRRRRRRSSSNSSSSSSGSSSSSDGSSTDHSSSSSGSSPSSGSDSESSESSEISSTDAKMMENDPNAKERRRKHIQHKRRQRRRHEVKMIARQLTHYVAPEVCDEVAHCMHHYKKDLKQSMARKIAGTIESAVTHAFQKCMDSKSLDNMTAVGEPKEENVEETSKEPPREQFYHADITCDGCEQDIFGSRYKCGNCPDYDLCEKCEAIEGIHDKTHVFLKMHLPAVNAGRKNGKGRMRPLLKENIYAHYQDDETREESIDSRIASELQEFDAAMQSQQALDLSTPQRQLSKEKKEENPTEKVIPSRTISSDSVPSKDEDVCAALEGLKIAQSADNVQLEKPVETKGDESSIAEEAKVKEQSTDEIKDANDSDDDDVVVVKHGDSMPQVKNLDLIDIDVESVSSNGSEDFVVVPIPSVFDTNSPLDEKTIMEHHLRCKEGHTGNCCPAAKILKEQRSESTPTTMPMDLVASSLPKSRPQPDIAPTQNLMDADLEATTSSQVIEKQPEQSVSDIRPLIPIVEQPTSTKMKRKSPEIDQPEPPVMYGRGAAPLKSKELAQEPDVHMIRDGGVSSQKDVKPKVYPDVATIDKDNVEKMTDNRSGVVAYHDDIVKDGGSAKAVVQDSVAMYSATSDTIDTVSKASSVGFNQPADKFLKQHHEHTEKVKKETLYKPPTWSPEPANGDGSVTKAVTGIVTDFVDATAHAVAAVGESVSNAINAAGSDLPTVKYQEEQVKIIRNDGTTSQAEPLRDPPLARSAQDMLKDMGFFDEAKNRRLLQKYQGDVNKCVSELLGDNDWHSYRH